MEGLCIHYVTNLNGAIPIWSISECSLVRRQSPESARETMPVSNAEWEHGLLSRPKSMLRKALFAWLFAAAFTVHVSAQPTEDGTEPALTSVFPLGGARGSRFNAVVRGVNLEG